MSTRSEHQYSSKITEFKKKGDTNTQLEYGSVSSHYTFNGVQFISPTTIFDRFYFPHIDTNDTIEVELLNKFKYKPEHLSSILYGTTEMWHILLRINNCINHQMFTGNAKGNVKVITEAAKEKYINFYNKYYLRTDGKNKKNIELNDLTLRKVKSFNF